MVESEFVFGYGSNMDPAQMRERCPESDLSWFVAEARGWKLCFPRHSKKRQGGVGSIMAAAGREVWGVVFSVSARDLARLDRYEGVPHSYARERIEVFDRAGQPFTVWSYFATAEEPAQHFPPHKDYLDLYLKGAMYFGLPDEYVQKLRAFREASDKAP